MVGQALSRAQEYTADNFGYRYCPEGGPGAIKVLTAGKYLNQQVNFDEFADRAVNDQGFAIWLRQPYLNPPGTDLARPCAAQPTRAGASVLAAAV